MKCQAKPIAKLIVLGLLTILTISGCFSLEPIHTTTRGQVGHHVWGALLSFGMEQHEYRGYAVYTYVLFNSNQPDIGSSEAQRYDSLLKAVLLDVKTREQGDIVGWTRQETNIFCIPFVTRSPVKANALEKYDFDLAFEYLGILEKTVKSDAELTRRLKERPGPFLISLNVPLPDLQDHAVTKMLYVDLTDMSPGGMREVLDVYRQRLDSDPLANIEKLKGSLRLTFLKYILKLDENLKIINVAYATTWTNGEVR